MSETELILRALLGHYFELLRQEKIGATPEITAEVDALEAKIKRIERILTIAKRQ